MKKEWKRGKESLSPCAFRVKGTPVILCSPPRMGRGSPNLGDRESLDPENLVSTPWHNVGLHSNEYSIRVGDLGHEQNVTNVYFFFFHSHLFGESSLIVLTIE